MAALPARAGRDVRRGAAARPGRTVPAQTGNSEFLFAWPRIAIRNRYEPALPALDRFLVSQGRRKFLRPLYADLIATDWGRPIAEDIYRRARPGYHAVSRATIDELLGVRG